MIGSIYALPDRRLERLDRRGTSYRFDLETDPAWHRIDEPGVHATPSLLAELGVDVDALGPHSAAFDWIFAAATCRTFTQFESWVIDFGRREQGLVTASASAAALLDEEAKHIALFERYERHLLSRVTDGERAAFERAYAATRKRMQASHERTVALPDPRVRHYLFWMATLFFEEFTVYMDDRLASGGARVQPTWASMHRLHRIEEMQHLATDEAYLSALDLEAPLRLELAQRCFVGVFQLFDDTVGIAAGLSYLAELGAPPVCPEGRLTQRGFTRALADSPCFRRTRAAAPNLVALLGRS